MTQLTTLDLRGLKTIKYDLNIQPPYLDIEASPLRYESHCTTTLDAIKCKSAHNSRLKNTLEWTQIQSRHKIFVSRTKPNVNQTRDLLIWRQTRYHCTMDAL